MSLCGGDIMRRKNDDEEDKIVYPREINMVGLNYHIMIRSFDDELEDMLNFGLKYLEKIQKLGV